MVGETVIWRVYSCMYNIIEAIVFLCGQQKYEYQNNWWTHAYLRKENQYITKKIALVHDYTERKYRPINLATIAKLLPVSENTKINHW